MKLFITTLFAVYFVITALLLGVDITTAIVERYSHFHMGHWSDQHAWQKAVQKICAKWAIKTPILRLKKDCRYILLDRIRGTYGKRMVQSWQKAGCVLGLQEAGIDKITPQVKAQLLNSEGSWKTPVNKIDYGMIAYALLKAEQNPNAIRRAMDSMVQCIESNLCTDGLVSYSGGKDSTRRYVDTLGFVCPFLALYGKVYHKPEYITLAIDQLRLFHSHGMIQGLPVHCFQSGSGFPIGVCGWGRGTGWYALGLIDLYSELDNKGDKEIVKPWIEEVACICLGFERHDGGFSTILPAQNVYDSSATAVLGYFYAKCGAIFHENKYTQVAIRCRNRLIKVTKINGVVDECQGDTIDIGIFSERYAPMPFAQGMALRLAAVLDQTIEE